MQFKYLLLALAAEQITSAIAAPSAASHHLAKRSFKVERVASGKTVQKNALKSMKKAFGKYGLPVPSGLANADESAWAAAARQDCSGKGPGGAGAGNNPKGGAGASSVPVAGTATVAAAYPTSTGTAGGQLGNVTNQGVENENEFVSPITVGGQQLVMDFDTGSSDLWVFNTNLPQQDQQGHQVFDPKQSKTFQAQSGQSFAVSYGDGSNVQGNQVGSDQVVIGGATASSQVVELPTAVAQSFVQDTHSNGLVGLAFSKINQVKPNQATTFLDTIHQQLAQPVLAANLRHDAPGSYEFGQVDNSAFTGQLNFVPVDNTNGFWQFPSNQFQIQGGQVQQNSVGSPAIADTGTTLMLVDDPVAAAYYQQVQGASQDPNTGMFTFPCKSKLPDLSVSFGSGNSMMTIPGALIDFQPLQPGTGGGAGGQKMRRRFDPKTKRQGLSRGQGQAQGQQCSGGVQGNQGQPIQIYGDVMFKAQYAVFNIGNNSIAFAPHAQNGTQAQQAPAGQPSGAQSAAPPAITALPTGSPTGIPAGLPSGLLSSLIADLPTGVLTGAPAGASSGASEGASFGGFGEFGANAD